MKKILSNLLIAVAAFGLLGTAALPAVASAQTKADICKGINFTAGNTGGGCDPSGNTERSVANLVGTIINILSWVVGIAAVIMIIIGGFKYIISGGDSGSITAAKNTILYALIGLVIVALAQVIVRFVITTV